MQDSEDFAPKTTPIPKKCDGRRRKKVTQNGHLRNRGSLSGIDAKKDVLKEVRGGGWGPPSTLTKLRPRCQKRSKWNPIPPCYTTLPSSNLTQGSRSSSVEGGPHPGATHTPPEPPKGKKNPPPLRVSRWRNFEKNADFHDFWTFFSHSRCNDGLSWDLFQLGGSFGNGRLETGVHHL